MYTWYDKRYCSIEINIHIHAHIHTHMYIYVVRVNCVCRESPGSPYWCMYMNILMKMYMAIVDTETSIVYEPWINRLPDLHALGLHFVVRFPFEKPIWVSDKMAHRNQVHYDGNRHFFKKKRRGQKGIQGSTRGAKDGTQLYKHKPLRQLSFIFPA